MSEDFGKLVLRFGVGGLVLFHGGYKLLNGLAPIKAQLVSHNIPETLAYGAYLGELVAPVLVIVGLFSRVGGLLIVMNMVVAVLLYRLADGAVLNATGGYALETEVLFLVAGLAVSLLGAGRFSIGGKRWN